ncbi:MAG: 2-amino-4-hydroxy-6-hydroxymethyldihydropteridine diphosphokinase [Thermoflexibacter sp.]
MQGIFLLLGGNIGDRLAYLKKATELIQQEVGNILQFSSLYETAPWGISNQAHFLNQAVEIQTDLDAERLLEKLLAIELALGRERHHKWYARTIDIDILLFGNEVISTSNLQIPHSQMQFRRFALIPLQEIASEVVHPLFDKTISQLLAECEDSLEVRKWGANSPPAPIGKEKTA